MKFHLQVWSGDPPSSHRNLLTPSVVQHYPLTIPMLLWGLIEFSLMPEKIVDPSDTLPALGFPQFSSTNLQWSSLEQTIPVNQHSIILIMKVQLAIRLMIHIKATIKKYLFGTKLKAEILYF